MALPVDVPQLGTFQGARGEKGVTGSLAFATATTLPSGSTATAVMVGPETNRGVQLGIPRGLDAVGAAEDDPALKNMMSAVDTQTGQYLTYRLRREAADARKFGMLEHAIMRADIASSRIAMIGDSNVNGGGANNRRNWVSMVNQVLQSNGGYRRYYNEVRPLIGDTTGIGLNGIHMFNGGINGATSADYLTPDTLAAIDSLKPQVVVHLLGSNDWAANRTPSIYEGNIAASIDAIDPVAPNTIHVLVQSHPRQGISPSNHPWSAYGDAMGRIAEARANVIYVDASGPFIASGLPASNTAGYIADGIHLTVSGYQLLANEFLSQLKIPYRVGDFRPIKTELALFTTDNFTGSGEILTGSNTDVARGGVAKTWVADTAGSGFIRDNGILRPHATAASRFVALALPNAGAAVTFRAAEVPTSGELYVELCRSALPTAAANSVQAVLNPNYFMVRHRTTAGVTTEIYRQETQWSNKDIQISCINDKIRVFIEGYEVARMENTVPLFGGYVGINRGASAGGAISRFTVHTAV